METNVQNNVMNFEGHKVEVFEWNGKVLFNPYHVGECLDLSPEGVRKAITRMSEKQVIKLTNLDVKDLHFRKLHNTGENFLTESGVLQLIQNSRNCSAQTKETLLQLFVDNKLISKQIILTVVKEIEFLDLLEETLVPFNISGERQYKVDNYKIDYYIPSLKVAIEYDENGHKDYSYDKQEGRQAYIEDKLGCRFIRVTDKYDNGYNVGLVLKNIFNL